MLRTTKIGIGLLVAALLAWGWPAMRVAYAKRAPLHAAMPLGAGEALGEVFQVPTTEHYELVLQCENLQPFREEWKNFQQAKNPSTLPCDFQVRVLTVGGGGEAQREIFASERLTSLNPASYADGVASWRIAQIKLPSTGKYELHVTNHADLSGLKPTSPTLHMKIDSLAIAQFSKSLTRGITIGIFLALLGLAFLFARRIPATTQSCPPEST